MVFIDFVLRVEKNQLFLVDIYVNFISYGGYCTVDFEYLKMAS